MTRARLAAKKADLQILQFHRREAEQRRLEGGDPREHAELCDTIAKLSR